MKKVGVITFSNTTHNYGQILQCYAMQQVIKSIECAPFLIQYNNSSRCSYKCLTPIGRFLKFISACSYYFHKMSSGKGFPLQPAKKEPDRHFEDFIKNHILTVYYDDVNCLYMNPPIGDAFICGSDQIWGTGTSLYYLDFIKDKKTKKIAYAPSFGGAKLNILDLLKIRILIKDFRHISVRENDGVEICKKCGRDDAIVVPDPTLILPVAEYKSIASSNLVPQHDYAFVYMLKNKTDFNIYDFEKEAVARGLKVIYVTANGLEDDYPKLYPTIEEWLGLIENASFVVTNSFHCSVFSLLFNKIFKIYPLTGSFSQMNLRFDRILKYYGIKQCDSVFDMKMDYSIINEKINNDADKYQQMLRSWIFE